MAYEAVILLLAVWLLDVSLIGAWAQLHVATRFPEEAIHAEMRRLQMEHRVRVVGFAQFRRHIYALVAR